jgi:hypothetical protein
MPPHACCVRLSMRATSPEDARSSGPVTARVTKWCTRGRAKIVRGWARQPPLLDHWVLGGGPHLCGLLFPPVWVGLIEASEAQHCLEASPNSASRVKSMHTWEGGVVTRVLLGPTFRPLSPAVGISLVRMDAQIYSCRRGVPFIRSRSILCNSMMLIWMFELSWDDG